MPRQLGIEVDAARALEGGQPLAAPGQQVGFHRRAGFGGVQQLHHGFHRLAQLVVRHADHRDVGHLRVADQHGLGFLRVDVHAAGNDHEGLAVHQVQVAVGVHAADIAQRRPALRIAGLCGARRVVVVFELRAVGKVDQAGLAGGQFAAVVVADVQHALRRAAHRTWVRQPFLRGDAAEAVVLGAGVVLVHDRAPPVQHALLHLHRAGRGGVHRHLQRRQVMPQAHRVGQLEHAHEHRRHPLAGRDAVVLDPLQCAFGVELLHHEHAATELDDRHAVAQRRGVVQRRGRQVARVAAVAEQRRQQRHQHGQATRGRCGHRPLHALGPARGA